MANDYSIGCGTVIVGVVLLGLLTSPSKDKVEPTTAEISAQAHLTKAVVRDCKSLISKATRLKIIRSRPSLSRIDVDEFIWADLDAKSKDNLLQAISCEVWETSMPPSSQYVVAYGWRSGKRIQMLTSTGMSRE